MSFNKTHKIIISMIFFISGLVISALYPHLAVTTGAINGAVLYLLLRSLLPWRAE